jgi:D-glycero-beta-D-manno-heptose 1-phosphate adenylyltransferase
MKSTTSGQFPSETQLEKVAWLRPAPIIPMSEIAKWRLLWRDAGKTVVVTNGCFDLLHVGHLRFLTAARELGDLLWVGINDDAAVRELKGAGRPVTTEQERAEILGALRVVDAVTIFPTTCATGFLTAVAPDVYAKGGDYTMDSLDPGDREALTQAGARIEILDFTPGRSTTGILQKPLD